MELQLITTWKQDASLELDGYLCLQNYIDVWNHSTKLSDIITEEIEAVRVLNEWFQWKGGVCMEYIKQDHGEFFSYIGRGMIHKDQWKKSLEPDYGNT